MAWYNPTILGSDLTEDMQFEIFKLIGGIEYANNNANTGSCAVALSLKPKLTEKLHAIYNMCKSQNKFEETWNMQVLGCFVQDNIHACQVHVNQSSMPFLLGHIKYEIDNIDLFGWSESFDKVKRLEHINSLYQDINEANFTGQYYPFGSQYTNTIETSGESYRNVQTHRDNSDTIVEIGTLPTSLGNCNVNTGMYNGIHNIMDVRIDWRKFVHATKQWSCRLLKTNRGFVVQTRWGKRTQIDSALRVSSKAFMYEHAARSYFVTLKNNKIHNGYREAET